MFYFKHCAIKKRSCLEECPKQEWCKTARASLNNCRSKTSLNTHFRNHAYFYYYLQKGFSWTNKFSFFLTNIIPTFLTDVHVSKNDKKMVKFLQKFSGSFVPFIIAFVKNKVFDSVFPGCIPVSDVPEPHHFKTKYFQTNFCITNWVQFLIYNNILVLYFVYSIFDHFFLWFHCYFFSELVFFKVLDLGTFFINREN